MRPAQEVQARASGDEATVVGRFQVRGLRWWIVGLIFLATVINYIDRQTVNVLSPVLIRELGLSKPQFGNIAAAFLAAYTVGMAVWGRLFDRLGTRLAFAASITLWSVAATMHALARGFGSLAAFRGLLGFGEAGNWPGAAKCISEWFPTRERAFALAIFNSGAALGAVIAMPVIIAIQSRYGWQRTFLFTGLLGFGWLALWLIVYRTPQRHRWITPGERALIEADAPVTAEGAAPVPYRELLSRRQVWAVIAARFCTDPVWWLYLVWLPQYLHEARGFALHQIAAFGWMPYLMGDLGALAGGYLSGALIRRGRSVNFARKVCLGIGAALMPAGLLAPRVADPMLALALIGVVLFAFQFWINNVQALPGDFFPSRAVGAVFGLGGAAAGLSSLALMLASGLVVQRFGYTPILTIAGLLGPLGAVAVFTLAPRIQRVSLPER